jgi:hypothetical protein
MSSPARYAENASAARPRSWFNAPMLKWVSAQPCRFVGSSGSAASSFRMMSSARRWSASASSDRPIASSGALRSFSVVVRNASDSFSGAEATPVAREAIPLSTIAQALRSQPTDSSSRPITW